MASIAQTDSKPKTVRLISSGTYVRVYNPPEAMESYLQRPQAQGGSPRGVIRGRSAQSRRRFQLSMGRINLSACTGVLLITLTFKRIPSHFLMAKFLDSFCKFLERRFGPVPIAWAKERGKVGGRWHYHLVVFAADYINVKAYQNAWNRIAGAHAGNVDVAFKKDAGIVRYLTKYLSKEVGVWQEKPKTKGSADATGGASVSEHAGSIGVDLGSSHISPKEGHTGRTWGWRRYESLPLYPWQVVKISQEAAHFMRRQVAKLVISQKKKAVLEWEGYLSLLRAGRKSEIPEWIRKYYLKNFFKNKKGFFSFDFMLSYEIALKKDELRRAIQKNWLARGGFDHHGWSVFFESGAGVFQRLGAYFDNDCDFAY